MENLLRNEFVVYYYRLNQSKFSSDTTEETIRRRVDIEKHERAQPYIGISDCGDHIEIHTKKDEGTGRFTNPNRATVTVINYDRFVKSLPNEIHRGKKQCDAILYTDTKNFFSLNEIKISGNSYAKSMANKQLLDSLGMLLSVPEIKTFVDTFGVKCCCQFIRRPPKAPKPISAITSFNRRNYLHKTGDQLQNSNIEKYGFALFRYQTGSCKLT